MKDLFEGEYCYCPICKSHFRQSQYLSTVFSNVKQKWLANVVMHGRHYHTAWDYFLFGLKNRNPELAEEQYDSLKSLHNEMTKLELLDKASKYLNFHKFTVDDFTALKSTSKKVIKRANHYLKTIPDKLLI